MVILENAQVPEHIKAIALSIDPEGFDSIGQIEGSKVCYAALYTRPDHLNTGSYGIVEDRERDLILYGLCIDATGAIVTKRENAGENADHNMREYIQISAVFQYECPARLDKQEQIDAVCEDLNRLLDADSSTEVECHGISISEHKNEAEIYSAISSIEVTLPDEIPQVVMDTAEALNPETFVDIEPLPFNGAFVARYLSDHNLRSRGQTLINCGHDNRVLKGIVIKADGSIPQEPEAAQILLGKDNNLVESHQRNRAENILTALRSAFEDEPDDPAVLLKDALCDLRHMCDAHGLSFGEIDKSAHALYVEELNVAPRAKREV